ncbi:MAG: hypothetical protein ABI240_00960 [Sphingomonas sp.]
MRMRLLFLAAAAGALLPSSAGAQSSQPPAAQQPVTAPADIIVRAVRSKPSSWREAETSHVIVLSDGTESELIRLTRNVERLHFLLSALLGRTNVQDDTIKLRITLIGDVAEFDELNLKNKRWQQGPFNDMFQISRYYDPREDGAVMATTRVDQRTVIERSPATAERVMGAALSAIPSGSADPMANPMARMDMQSAVIGSFATAGMSGSHDLTVTHGEHAIEVPAESLLYAGYAQHYLLTYFPAAYPRWYLDGFGQIFASFATKGNTILEFGRSPRGTAAVLDVFGNFPVQDIFNEKYLTEKPSKTDWTPIHAWLLTHFLMFSDTRRPQLRQYLTARNNGADPVTAAAVFGDEKQFASELRAYYRARKPYEQVSYPVDKTEEPIVHRLTQGQAAFIKGRLELGGRILIPPAPSSGMEPLQAKVLAKARVEALKQRDKWLQRLREDASRWSGELSAQLLLAEAECRSDNAAQCLAAAERAQSLAPSDARPLVWKGTAMVQLAAAAPAAEREAQLVAARKVIAAANRADLEAVQPLLAYYASYVASGATPPVTAIDGLQKAVGEVPSAPVTRLQLATALADRGQNDIARKVIRPVASGPYDSPERSAARALIDRTGVAESSSAAPSP